MRQGMGQETNRDLAYTPEVAAATKALYARVAHVMPEIEWAVHAPYVKAINDLKRAKNAVILGHNYMTPEIFHCVSDFAGDSLQLAREAARTDAKIIVQAGVHFMAETSKILSPDKMVLIPDMQAGCSLAASITGADVRLLKEKYPGLPVVTYVNTSADVKAESDVCCTLRAARRPRVRRHRGCSEEVNSTPAFSHEGVSFVTSSAPPPIEVFGRLHLFGSVGGTT